MENTSVTFYKMNFAVLTKGKHRAAVFVDGTTVMIVDPDYDMIVDIHEAKNSKAAHNKMLKLIGKMCRKSVDSKYFRNHEDIDYKKKYWEKAVQACKYLQEVENGTHCSNIS